MIHEDWFCISHVCQAWRDLILGNPLLWWTFPNISHSPEWTREQLRCSGSVPLNINIALDYDGLIMHKLSWELVLSQLTHIRSLKIIWLLELESHDLYSTTITKDAPCLESLMVHLVDATDTSFPDLFNSQTPHLCHVMIWGIRSVWSLSLLRNLHTLVIISTTGCQELISKVLDVLEQMPAFQILKLHYSLPKYTRQHISAHTNPRRVALRSLSQLNIGEIANSAAYFMSHLDLPEGVISNIDLSRCSYLYKESQDTLIAFAIKTYRNLTMDPRPRGLELNIELYWITFRVTFGHPGIIDTISNDCPFTFKFGYKPPYRNPHLWSAMINTIPLLDIHFLNIVCNELVDFSWKSLFESLRNLECVEIVFQSAMTPFIAAYNATRALEETGPHRYDPDANPIPLPSLHSLSLKSIKFDDDSLLDELIDLLTMRDKHGYRLPLLTVPKPRKSQDNELRLFEVWVAELSPLVEKLEW